jgi:hypothetical protein
VLKDRPEPSFAPPGLEAAHEPSPEVSAPEASPR